MALGPRLDLRQSQSLVMTPQLQQAIKLLALSNLELETFIGEAIEANPLLELGEAGPVPEPLEPVGDEMRRTQLESSPVDQLIGEGRAADDRPLDIDRATLDTDRDTGDGAAAFELSSASDFGGHDFGASDFSSGGEAPSLDERGGGEATLAEHLHGQIGAASSDRTQVALGRWLIDQLDEAGYLPLSLA